MLLGRKSLLLLEGMAAGDLVRESESRTSFESFSFVNVREFGHR